MIDSNDIDLESGGGCGSDELFALQVLGDSMAPEFNHGCIVVIDPAGVIQNGSFVIAMHEGEHIFRQLLVQGDRFYLKPMKESYETFEIESLDVIKGVVVQRAGTRRKDRKHYIESVQIRTAKSQSTRRKPSG